MSPRTITEALDASISEHPDREAYVQAERRISYAELEVLSSRYASAFFERGVRRGDIVCLAIPSSIDFAAAYLGAVKIGAITSAINQRIGPVEQTSILLRTKPRVVVSTSIPDALRPDELTTHTDFDAAAVSEDGAVAIVWTSGTTGAPKGAVYTHRAMRFIHEGMGDLSAQGDRRLVSLPFAHMGFMTRIFNELVSGTTLVLVGEPWSARRQIELIAEEQISVVTGVPTQWELMLACPEIETVDTSSVRVAGIGGSLATPELIRKMRRTLRCPVMCRYTSTEAGLISGTNIGDSDATVALTVGRPSPVVSLRLADPASGVEVNRGEVGEIRTRSDAMFSGYFDSPDLTAAAFDEAGYLRTGDLGRIDEGGNLCIVGRLKEMYIRGGYNVYPAEVEAVLAEHPAIRAAAVVGAPAEVLGEVGVAFVVCDTAVDLADVRAWCGSRLADYKAPDRLVTMNALPLTAGHKIDKQALIAILSNEDG